MLFHRSSASETKGDQVTARPIIGAVVGAALLFSTFGLASARSVHESESHAVSHPSTVAAVALDPAFGLEVSDAPDASIVAADDVMVYATNLQDDEDMAELMDALDELSDMLDELQDMIEELQDMLDE